MICSSETDSLYSNTGTDTYDLGYVDDEISALQCQRHGIVIPITKKEYERLEKAFPNR